MIKKLIIIITSIVIITTIWQCCNSFNSPIDDNESPAYLDSITLASLQKVDNYPFYTMRYYSDYHFAEFANRSSINWKEIDNSFVSKDSAWACTCFAALGDINNFLFGRNFDWHELVPLLLYTDPEISYASISMVDLEYFGYDRNNLPDEWDNRQDLLGTPWMPFDGMNEKGLTVGVMAVPNARPPYDPNKISVDEIAAVRLLLDFAEDVDEAINLMSQYNIVMTDPPIHYLVADASGNAVVIEFVNGEMKTIRNTEPWLVSTNFIISGSTAPHNVSCWRYDRAYNDLASSNGALSIIQGMNTLQKVSQSNTRWSTLYNIKNKDVHIALGTDYYHVLTYSFSQFSISVH
ncbi:MAG: hypothetical protein A2V66_00525 [Ignavibacteria bacterium RBG_13_36_8]|nr:MAG: hypothetical protein A2V66_00525 [Ignavibacteria bacterium RBG_13_36_8]